MNKKDIDNLKRIIYNELLESPFPRRPRKPPQEIGRKTSSSGTGNSSEELGVCPHCGRKVNLSEAKIGTVGNCPYCKGNVVVGND